MKYTRECTDCGTYNDPMATGCVRCGTELRDIMITEVKPEAETTAFCRCLICGTKNSISALKCITCGNVRLDRSAIETENDTSDSGCSSDDCAKPDTAASSHPQTISLRSISNGIFFEIPEEGGLIGRTGTVGAGELESYPTVGRIHLKIEKNTDGWIAEDLDSTNGTRINGRKLKGHAPEKIKVNDTLSIADLHFRVVASGEADEN